jgi:site-specific DNA-methyltransferase (adenine-specific)
MLSPRQKQIFEYIKKFLKEKDYSPSLKEIGKRFKIGKSTVHQHLEALKERGYLDKVSYQPRTIEITKNKKSDLVAVTLAGTIAAGEPIEAVEEKETIAVPKNKLPRGGETFALRVKGDSMVDEGIHDGDTILIKKQAVAENGDKVVALLNGNEATLKTLYKEKRRIRLQPANKNYQPIIIKNGQELAIQGILLDVIKTEETEQSKQTFALPKDKNNQRKGKISDYLNKIYNGDVMELLKNLTDNSVDMIFGDPDYNVGKKYGENNYTTNFEDYIAWYIELARQSMRVLKNDGNLFMLNYPQQNAHLRVKYLDLHFPNIHEYVWVYNTNVGHTPKRFTTAHRSILHVRKSANNKFFKDAVALPYKNPMDRRIRQNLANGSKGRMPYSWFEFNLVKNVSKEKTYHACQIPQKLTEMLIKASTKENDTVLVLFGGSGAELEMCKKMERNFISAEIDKKYCELIQDRIKNGYIRDDYKLKLGHRENSSANLI